MIYQLSSFTSLHSEYPIIYKMEKFLQGMGYILNDSTLIELYFKTMESPNSLFCFNMVSIGANKKVNQVSLTIFKKDQQKTIAS